MVNEGLVSATTDIGGPRLSDSNQPEAALSSVVNG
jgi:hypothetical protein